MFKVLVEKLLRSTRVEKIYVLIRPKKGIPSKARLKDLLSAKIFDKVKESSTDIFDRIDTIEGDISKKNFGINEKDLQ